MADAKITSLSEDTTPDNDDITVIVDDVAGTPTTKKATLGNVLRLARGLILVEKKLITSAVTDVTFSGLDGDTDKVYELIGRIIIPSGGGNPIFSWQPNGITTNQSSRRFYATSLGVATDTQVYLSIVQAIAGTVVSFSITIHASKVENSVATLRHYIGTWLAFYNGTDDVAGHIAGRWNETSTNITSLVVHSDVASKIGDGSTFALYKYAQS